MNRTARHLLFWTFIAFFLVSAPAAVLYTAGFRYNLQKGSFVRTGVISITTSPRNADLFLDDIDIEKTSPFVIKQIIPGEYELRVQKDGYHPWNETVEVRSGETANIHNIFLLLNNSVEELFIKSGSSMAPSPTGSVAYLVQEGGWEEVWIFNTATASPELIDRYSIFQEEDSIISWSSSGDYLHIQNESNNILNFYHTSGEKIDIDPKLFDEAKEMFWHPSEGHLLYIASEESLTQYDVRTGDAIELSDEDAVTILIDASTLTFIDNGDQVELHQTALAERNLIALLPRASYDIVNRDGSYLILQDARNNIILLDIRAHQPILLEAYAHAFAWNEDSDQLVYTDGNEVNTYSPATHSIEFITRQSQFIESISWHQRGSHILIATNTSLTAIETYRIGKERVTTPLTTLQSIESFWLSPNEETVFIHGKENGAEGLYKLEITK